MNAVIMSQINPVQNPTSFLSPFLILFSYMPKGFAPN